ncbi:MAG: hypothetical protein K1X89_12045 [Myxococcaceae bacterium]|nr:hypothetical protein [Myxococcaceae bacterium]
MTHASLRGALALSVLLLGCNVSVKVNPEGLRCDDVNTCPDGYECHSGACHATSTASGGGSGSTGGGMGGGMSSGGGSAACDGVTCNAPPPPQCTSDSVLRTFTAPGTCADGACTYAPMDITCAKGCLSGMCKDACSGVACTTPPMPACKNASTLFTYDAQGTCTAGTCDYKRNEVPCANGCAAGACTNQNLCMGVTCNTPPMPACMGNTLRRYTMAGTCNPGTGQCSYGTPVDTVCPNGCANATCLSASLAFGQTMPRVPFPVNAIDVAPQSAGKVVLAVGPAGQAMAWDGAAWSKVGGLPSTAGLRALWFSGPKTAYAVGEGRAVYHYASGAFTAVPGIPDAGVGGAGSGSLVSVHGVDDNDMVTVDGIGNFWRYTSGSWSAFSAAPNSFFGAQVYVEDATHIRVAGRCTAGPCVAFQGSSFLSFDVDNGSADPKGFLAVGPAPGTDAWAGHASNLGMRRHQHNGGAGSGGFDATGVPTLSQGDGVSGITGSLGVVLNRVIYVLTRGSSTPGALYAVTATTTATPRVLLNTFSTESAMSRNDVSGVVVAEVLRAKNVNDIFRRSVTVDEALDLGEDWVAAGVLPGPTVALVGKLGDVAARVGTSPTWNFVHYPQSIAIDDAAFGYAGGMVLMGGTGGDVLRFTPPATFDPIDIGTTTANINGVCRASDAESLVVGSQGVIRAISVTGTPTVKTIASGITTALNAVDCPVVGDAVACGNVGVVLRIRNGVATPVTPALPNSPTLTSCRLVGNTIYVVGNNLFARMDTAAPSPKWDMLQAAASLDRLQVVAPNDIYAVSAGNLVTHYDGNAWSTALSLPGTARLVGGGQMGAKVVFAGNSGVVVESP